MRILGLGVVAVIMSAQAAYADCKVNGPATMYLGDGGSYSLRIDIAHKDTCSLNFSGLNAAVKFDSAEIVARAHGGAATKTGPLSFSYNSPAKGATDSFSLKVCGTDTHGHGCNRLNYNVQLGN